MAPSAYDYPSRVSWWVSWLHCILHGRPRACYLDWWRSFLEKKRAHGVWLQISVVFMACSAVILCRHDRRRVMHTLHLSVRKSQTWWGALESKQWGKKFLAVQHSCTDLAKMEWESKWNGAIKNVHRLWMPHKAKHTEKQKELSTYFSVRGRSHANSLGERERSHYLTAFKKYGSTDNTLGTNSTPNHTTTLSSNSADSSTDRRFVLPTEGLLTDRPVGWNAKTIWCP